MKRPVKTNTLPTPPPRLILFGSIVLILIYWVTRLYAIESAPFFIDEGLHVVFSEATLEVSPVAYASKYYLFSIWWWSFFNVPAGDPVWISRAVTVLACTIGLASSIGLGRMIAGVWGALLVGLIYLFSPYHMFYERLALADPISAAGVVTALYFGYRLTRRSRLIDAFLCGLSAFIAVGAKLSALPYLAIPVAAWLLLRPDRRQQLRWLTTAIVTEGVLMTIYVGVLVLIGSNPFSNASGHVVSDDGIGGSLARIPAHLEGVMSDLVYMLGPVGMLVLVAALGWLLIRRQFYLFLCLLLPAMLFLFSAMQSARYYAAPMTLLVVAVGVALADITRTRARWAGPMFVALIGVWAVISWLPFSLTMAQSPDDLLLPPDERHEYLESDASGTGLDEIVETLIEEDATNVIGIMANCQGLRYEAVPEFETECPTINPNGESIAVLDALMEENRGDDVFVVLEDLPYLPEDAPGEIIETIEFESGRPTLTVYDLSP
jgi:hypothetical protein